MCQPLRLGFAIRIGVGPNLILLQLCWSTVGARGLLCLRVHSHHALEIAPTTVGGQCGRIFLADLAHSALQLGHEFNVVFGSMPASNGNVTFHGHARAACFWQKRKHHTFTVGLVQSPRRNEGVSKTFAPADSVVIFDLKLKSVLTIK